MMWPLLSRNLQACLGKKAKKKLLVNNKKYCKIKSKTSKCKKRELHYNMVWIPFIVNIVQFFRTQIGIVCIWAVAGYLKDLLCFCGNYLFSDFFGSVSIIAWITKLFHFQVKSSSVKLSQMCVCVCVVYAAATFSLSLFFFLTHSVLQNDNADIIRSNIFLLWWLKGAQRKLSNTVHRHSSWCWPTKPNRGPWQLVLGCCTWASK